MKESRLTTKRYSKSQIAIEHAYQVRDRSPKTWVFWIHASNAMRYEQSFRELADLARIFRRRNPQNNIFQLVQSWLRSEKSGKWVIILDNVDEADFLVDSQRNLYQGGSNNVHQAPLISYIPHCQNGSVLITSRSGRVARELVEPRNIITIEPMSQVDALSLIRKKSEN